MVQKRSIESMLAVFDLSDFDSLNAPSDFQSRIMVVYDRSAKKREVRVLDAGISQEMRLRIDSWFCRNRHLCDSVWGIF